jgi:DNA polymerase/3'-5' exonuclease PolX
MKKQSTLFAEPQAPTLSELDFANAQKVADRLNTLVCPYCEKLEIAGSLRRQRHMVHDVDFVVVTKTDSHWLKINDELNRLKAKPLCQGTSVIKALVPCPNGFFQVDFYRAQPSTFGIHLLVRTGSAEHNMWLAGYAISKGMRIKYSQGLLKDSVVVAGADEKEVFEALGLSYPNPTQREMIDDKPMWQIQHPAMGKPKSEV